jgi:hypothetical protein
LRHIQAYRLDSIQLDGFWVSRRSIDLSRSRSEQFLREYQTESSVGAGYKGN